MQLETGKSVKAFVPVPRHLDEWVRKSPFNRTLNDLVEEIHIELVNSNENYRKFLDAVYDEQAVEGSLVADNLEAARIIREAALKERKVAVSNQKLATLSKALNLVLKRYNQSRKDRRNTVGGHRVDDTGGE